VFLGGPLQQKIGRGILFKNMKGNKFKIRCMNCGVGNRTYIDHDGSNMLEGVWIEHDSMKIRSIFGWLFQLKCSECDKRTLIKNK
jgi:ribosomal protein S27E